MPSGCHGFSPIAAQGKELGPAAVEEFGFALARGPETLLGLARSGYALGDDCGVSGIGLGFAGVQISDAAYGQSGQDTFRAGDGYRKCTDGRGLIDDERQSIVNLELGDEGSQLDLVVGERLVIHTAGHGTASILRLRRVTRQRRALSSYYNAANAQLTATRVARA